jgi:ABC-type amino acid transport system permease subunit
MHHIIRFFRAWLTSRLTWSGLALWIAIWITLEVYGRRHAGDPMLEQARAAEAIAFFAGIPMLVGLLLVFLGAVFALSDVTRLRHL